MKATLLILLTCILISCSEEQESSDLIDTDLNNYKESIKTNEYDQDSNDEDDSVSDSSNKNTNIISSSVKTDAIKELQNCSDFNDSITTVCKEINYAGTDNTRQTLNLWIPCKINECSNKQYPVVIHIHGGGFAFGSKLKFPKYNFLKNEIAFASINYRLIPQGQFPVYLHDAKAAIRWIRGNSSKYHIDPNNIGIMGESAGGALTSYLAFTNEIKELIIDDTKVNIEGNVGKYLNESSKIQAAINYFGHADSKKFCAAKMGLDPNCNEKSTFCFACTSPISYIGKSSSPVPYMIIHGTNDTLVPYEHGKLLFEKFSETYLKNQPELSLITIQNGGHGNWDDNTSNKLKDINTNFFVRNLKNDKEIPYEKTKTIISECAKTKSSANLCNEAMK